MALSGTFSNSYRGYTYQINWSAEQNISGNYSTITCIHKLICGSTWGLSIGSRSNTCVVNNISVGFTSSSISTGGGKTFTLGTTTHKVNHNSDGTGSFSITGTFKMMATISGVYVDSIVTSGSATLSTIARASTIASAANVTLGNNCSVAFTPASSSFYYQMYFTLGNWSVSTGWISPNTTSLYTYTGLNLSGTLADGSNDTIYAQLSSATSGTMTVELRTYTAKDTGTHIGTDSKTFTVTIPESVRPTISSDNITLTPQTYNHLIQNKNTVNISVSGCTPGAGSSISSYTYSGPGISATSSSTSATSSIISNTGTLTYTVTVKDSRGRTASATKTITCYAYTAPYFTSFNAYRVASSSSATASDDGVYIRYAYGLSYSSVNSSNKITVKLKYKTSTGSWTSVASDITNGTATSGSKIVSKTDGFGTDTTYVVCAEISDSYGGTSTSTSITIFSAERILNVRPSGRGIAFGKMAGTDNLLDSKWAIKTDSTIEATGAIKTGDAAQTMQNLSFKGSNVIPISGDTTPNWCALGNLATVFYTPDGQVTDKPSEHGLLLNITNGPTSWAEVHQLWSSQAGGDLYHRGGNGNLDANKNGWACTWKKILDSSNYTSYVNNSISNTSAKPTQLYSSTGGTSGTVTLSYSAANYSYIEIFYMDNNSNGHNSMKIYSPNNKKIDISAIEPSDASASRTYIRRTLYTISGTSITPDGSVKGYVSIDGSTESGLKITHMCDQNYLKIYRVIGYN